MVLIINDLSMTKKNLFLIILFVPFLLGSVFGQDDILDITKRIEPIEPSAAALGKYGEYPVNYSSGLPNIEIPIYTIRSGDIQIPIKLSYHGGGIQVSEDASWVGLGWSLSYGGEITRQVNGRPDEACDISIAPRSSEVSNYMDSHPKDYRDSYVENLSTEEAGVSNMRDIFHFNLSGASGKFIYDDNGDPFQIPFGDYKIDFDGVQTNTIILPDGTKYDFEGTDNTEILPNRSNFPDFVSTWRVSQISSATGTDEINYSYQDDGRITQKNLYYSEGIEVAGIQCSTLENVTKPISFTSGSSSQNVISKKPSTIEFPNGRIHFVLGPRDDIYHKITDINNPGLSLQRLNKIIVEEKLNGVYSTKETYVFEYSYFKTGSSMNPDYLRLKLDRVMKYDKIYSEEDGIVVADFSYYESTSYPHKGSYSMDYWGYYNGRTNWTPIPKTFLGGDIFVGGADRRISEDKVKVSSLKSITYPTGGETVFKWESNRSGASSPVVDYVSNGVVSVCGNPFDRECSDPDPGLIDPELGGETNSSIKIFTNYSTQTVNLSYFIKQHITYSHQHNKYDKGRLILTNLTTGSILLDYSFKNRGQQTKIVQLHGGDRYSIEAISNCNNLTACLSLSYNSYNPSNDIYNYPVGGLRVNAIENYDSDNTLLGKKIFTYKVPGTEHSSGVLTNRETKTFVKSQRSNQKIGASNDSEYPGDCGNKTTTRHLGCSNAVTGISSNTVTYQYVQVFNVDQAGNNNGYTEYEFDVCEDTFKNDDIPLVSNAWNRGQLKRESTYKRVNDTYNKVKETLNYYSIDSRVDENVRCLKVVRKISGDYFCNYCGDVTLASIYNSWNYFYHKKWKRKDRTETTTYENGKELKVTEYFYYDSNNYSFPNRVKTIGSRGESIERITKYPLDYTNSNSTVAKDNVHHYGVMTKMKNANMLALPIETIRKNGTRFLEARHNNYNEIVNNINLTDIYVQNKSGLLGTNNITYPNQTELSILYNNDEKIKQALGITGISSSFWWGYENQFVVAKIVNLKYSEISTSLQSLLAQLDDFNQLSTLDKGQLKTLNTSIRATLPIKAQISTYTYSPLNGMTSQTDPNGNTTYYEYDGYGRLIMIKDQDDKILNQNFYHLINGDEYDGDLSVGSASSVNVLTISGGSQFFGMFGGSGTVTISSNVNWMVSKSDLWIKVSSTSGNGNGSIDISCAKYIGSNRNGTVTITGGGITKTIYVTQGDMPF